MRRGERGSRDTSLSLTNNTRFVICDLINYPYAYYSSE